MRVKRRAERVPMNNMIKPMRMIVAPIGLAYFTSVSDVITNS